jgi:hypothetical protein
MSNYRTLKHILTVCRHAILSSRPPVCESLGNYRGGWLVPMNTAHQCGSEIEWYVWTERLSHEAMSVIQKHLSGSPHKYPGIEHM